MKNVLLIVPPRGTPRIKGLIRYISEFGWQPIILTRITSRYKDLPARVIETPYRDVLGFLGRWFKIDPEQDAEQQIKNRFGEASRKFPLDFLLNLGGAIVNYPCHDKNWKPFALEASGKLLEKESIDAIISSSAPVTSHLIASELKNRYKIPWVADFRDLWSQNHNYSYGPIRRLMDKRLEIKTLAKADALVTVSEPWAEKLKALHKGRTVYLITNGFDPGEVNIPPVRLTPKFTITYTGAIYQGKQNPWRFVAALSELISDGLISRDDVEVRFYGAKLGWLSKEAEEYGLSDIVRQYGQVSADMSLEKQKESQLLLFLNWDDPEEHGVYSGKIFEYFGARRPILATGGEDGDVVTALLQETGAGVSAFDKEGIKGTLREQYREYKTKGEITFRGDEVKINKYTHREMARKFFDILDGLLG